MRLAIKFGPPPDLTPPGFLNSPTGSVAENATLAFALLVGEISTFSIVGGADAAEFELSSAGPGTSTTLRFASNGTRDFEAPADADTDNDYVVTVRATDAALNDTDQTVTITVTDVVESVAEDHLGLFVL